jgi:hypothetical protein
MAEIARELERVNTPINAKAVSRLKSSTSKTPSRGAKPSLEDKKATAAQVAMITLLQSQLDQAKAQVVEANNRAEILSAGHEEELAALSRQVEEQRASAQESRTIKSSLEAIRWDDLASAMALERVVI